MNDINQEDEIIVEAEEWIPFKVYSIGEYLTLENKLYKVIEDSNETCNTCDFINEVACDSSPCVSGLRNDDKDINFTLYDTLEEEYYR